MNRFPFVPWVMGRRRLNGCVLLIGACIVCMFPSQVRADGDPGSDVLVYQPLFVAADAHISIPEQVQLTAMLRATAKGGAPVRVAIISHRSDLGAVTALWGKPASYAHFLGYELSLSYKGQLLVVMPDGFGLNWPGHSTAAASRMLSEIRIGAGGSDLVAAAEAATRQLAARVGIMLTPGRLSTAPSADASVHDGTTTIPTIVGSQPATQPTPTIGSASSTTETIALVAVVALALLGVALALGYHGRWRVVGRAIALWLGWRGMRPALACVGLAALAAVAVVTLTDSSGTSAEAALATNPYLDPGSLLSGKPAPDFTLYDQTGHAVSLRSFRGKVTILAFNDSECTTICPLTTTAMLDARRMLGAQSRHVQLLGIDANPKAIQVEDVLSYTQLHGMVGKWDFLTGTLPQLKRVWHAYGIEAAIQRGLISHTPALYVIDPHGRLRKLYMTQQSYASVDQFGQVLAREASSLLPGHPPVRSHLSYQAAPSTPPTQTASLPRADGGHVTIGPGKPRLYLFFDTWDREVSSLGGELDVFNRYVHSSLPSLTAIDEGSVEPSASALPRFLAQLPEKLDYPVAIDPTGKVADGYEVQGVPWLVLTSATGKILWYDEIIDAKWPTVVHVRKEVHAALSKTGENINSSATQDDLIGSPQRLAALHAQASKLIGDDAALMARIRSLHGYPIVVNIWGSWCPACQAEFGLFATASAQYGRKVAFLGADTDDSDGDAQAFLREHHVSYPSYTDSESQLDSLLRGGLIGYPTTLYINRDGKVVHVQTGEYASQGGLDYDITRYALDGS